MEIIYLHNTKESKKDVSDIRKQLNIGKYFFFKTTIFPAGVETITIVIIICICQSGYII
jgi:hypothetical protein